jgi:hypothetical protein
LDRFQTEIPSYNFYTPRNEVVGGYTDFTMFVRPSVNKSMSYDNLSCVS